MSRLRGVHLPVLLWGCVCICLLSFAKGALIISEEQKAAQVSFTSLSQNSLSEYSGEKSV